MDRKSFLKFSAAGITATLLPGTSQIHGIPLSYQKKSIAITDVEAYRFKKATFIKISTNEGINGWGESDGSNRDITPLYVEKELKKYIIGKNPFDSEGIWKDAYLKGLEAGSSGLHPGSLAGVDNALWDLKGKILNVPAYKLLGGSGISKIMVYGSYGRHIRNDEYHSPKVMAQKAVAFVEQGYRAVKARMQIRQHNVNPYPDDIFDVVREIRTAIGDDIELFINFNNGYTPAKAVVMGKKLYEHFNIAALEEPVFQDDYDGLREVVEALDYPVMAGEHEYNLWMMKRLIVEAGVDFINADVIKCGGITECKKVAALAHAFGKQIMVHNAKPTLATAASLQLLSSIPNAATFQEYAGKRTDEGYGDLFQLFDNYFEFKDGYLTVPDEPGLGLIVNEKAMEKTGFDHYSKVK